MLRQIADRHPHRNFAAVTSQPRRALRLGRNVTPAVFAELADNRAPVLVCVADDEAVALRSCVEVEAGRLVVARRNHRLIERFLDPGTWRDRPVLVVTNPVELFCARLAEVAGHESVFGVGMQLDAQRCRDVLAAGWAVDLEPHELPVTGMHGLGPVPVLSAVPGLLERVGALPWTVVTARLQAAANSFRLPWIRHPERMAAVFERRGHVPSDDPHGRVAVAVAALTAAEFERDHPPADRAIGHVARLVDAWFDGGTVPVAGPRRVSSRNDELVYLGGLARLPDGEFRVPDLSPVESALVADQVARMRALAAAVAAA
ncbi:Rossmann-fold NAD(P)-binding domain-containing protein [Actinophytocola xanthii]|uniref:Uncharacterized protein n=1 Tax=Actinophytocola xanthii TaxID=1912961 RepID=A0A1Q8CXQ3_9PSEU|nr:hypothetical protein [Actinophytocola xanthii]OLF19137.1 hypothetical protein BU204_01830 [Actinophytocola xanthii]